MKRMIVTGFVLAIACLLGYGAGVLSVPGPVLKIVEPDFQTGYPPLGMPVLAIYESNSVIEATALFSTDDYRLFEYASCEQLPVGYQIYDEPIAWYPLSPKLIAYIRSLYEQ